MLRGNEVHLWFADLRQPRQVVQAFSDMISTDEQARAGRFHHERDRRRYVISRGLLRLILSRYLAVEARDLGFGYGEWGKPAIPESKNGSRLQFNVSHSAQGVMYAIAPDRRVGIDIECIRTIPEADDIADRFFSDDERRACASASPRRRDEVFLELWTRREAFLKALGHGWNAQVPAAAFSDIEGGHWPAWLVRTFRPTGEYIAAVAVEGDHCDFKEYCAVPRSMLAALGRAA
ncbi:MAG TPA: 4'-phosphopantetheinyl transferase superfamily protein [Anaerolineales bacterium]|nr:4'-phosphopantetheinyl transferase superfamily protein [Anaerolineales bacterium]